MAAQWFYSDYGRDFGPLSAADLRRLADTKIVGPTTLVRKGADGKWVPANAVTGLFNEPIGQFSAPPPLPPPLPPLIAAGTEIGRAAGEPDRRRTEADPRGAVHPLTWIAIGCGAMAILVLIAAINGFFAVPRTEPVVTAPSRRSDESARASAQVEHQARLLANTGQDDPRHRVPTGSSTPNATDRVSPDGRIPRAAFRALWAATRDSIVGVNDPAHAHVPLTQSEESLTAEALFAKASPAVVWIESRYKSRQLVGLGSGFIVSEDGLLVTNHHVIAGADSAIVHMTDGKVYAVLGLAADDSISDLALLKIDADHLPKLELAGLELPRVGTRVYAIGSPATKELQFTNTLSDGLVSAIREPRPGIAGVQTIQISVPVGHGSSGGPLLTPVGKVVGVVALGFHDFGTENINGAVPVSFVKRLIDRRGKVEALASFGGPRTAQDYVSLGDAYFGMERFDYAIGAYRTALKIDTNSDVHEKLGCAYAALRSWPLAIESFKAAAAKAPNSGDSYRRLGAAYDGAGQKQLAIAAFKRAVSLNDDDDGAHAALGYEYIVDNHYDAAEHEFKVVLANPRSTLYWQIGAHFYWGECEWQKWQIGAAIAQWKQACALDLRQNEGSFAKRAKEMMDMIEQGQSVGLTLKEIRAANPMKLR